jgi:hypothetical protein
VGGGGEGLGALLGDWRVGVGGKGGPQQLLHAPRLQRRAQPGARPPPTHTPPQVPWQECILDGEVIVWNKTKWVTSRALHGLACLLPLLVATDPWLRRPLVSAVAACGRVALEAAAGWGLLCSC